MSQENVETVSKMLVRAQSDPEAMYALLADDVEWDVRDLELPGPDEYRGHDGVRAFFVDWVGAFEDWGYEALELMDAGDAVVAQLRQWGRGKGSGAEVEIKIWQVWTIRDGEVVRSSHHLRREQALEAAGLAA